MVTAFTGVLILFRDFGLSSAAIQRANVTEEQISTLFWINLPVGAVQADRGSNGAGDCAFHHEPRLIAVTVVWRPDSYSTPPGSNTGAAPTRDALYRAGSDQHCRFDRGYCDRHCGRQNRVRILGPGSDDRNGPAHQHDWLLAGHGLASGNATEAVGIRSMMRFGGTLTLNGLVVYVANNLEKVLLGRFWGVDALGSTAERTSSSRSRPTT